MSSAVLPLAGAWYFFFVFMVLQSCQAFFPSDWREDSVGRHGISHESQTRAAFRATAAEFFGITELSTSMEHALKTIAIYNQLVDKRQFHSEEHFDGESFPEGQARLLRMKKDIASHLAVYDVFAARQSCGEALHTLQDFYAHSNWIEGQPAGAMNLYPGLGEDLGVIGGPTILDDRDTKSTCQDCISKNDDLFLQCDDCTFNAFTTVLTSGYYQKEDRQPPNGIRKCHHGGPKDIVRKDGINKDSLSCYWSPHFWAHVQAAQTSESATENFFRQLRDTLPADQLKLLYGVGPSLGFAVDTTGSMEDVISAVRTQLVKIVDSRVASITNKVDVPNLFVIAPFNDPTTEPVFVTPDPAAFKAKLKGLGALGGGDCPELSMGGVLGAIQNLDSGANLFLITDAAAKDSALAGTVVKEAQKKQIKIHCLIFYSGCSGDTTYFDIAAATGGQYFPLPRADAGSIITLADKFARAHVTPIWEIISVNYNDNIFHPKNRRQSSQEYDVPVDGKMNDLTFVYNGTGSITVTRPDGSVVSTSDPNISEVSFTGGMILNIVSPVAGIYKAVVPVATKFSLTIFGESTLHFSDFVLVESSGRDGHDGYFPLDTPPDQGSVVFGTAFINGAFNSAKFELRELDGTFIQPLDLTPGTGEDGMPPTNYFFGQIPIGTKPRRVYLKGTDGSGIAYQRVYDVPVTPSNVASNGTIPSNMTSSSTNSTASVSGRPSGSASLYPSGGIYLNHTTAAPTPSDIITTIITTTVVECPYTSLITTNSTVSISIGTSLSTRSITITSMIPCTVCYGPNYPSNTSPNAAASQILNSASPHADAASSASKSPSAVSGSAASARYSGPVTAAASHVSIPIRMGVGSFIAVCSCLLAVFG